MDLCTPRRSFWPHCRPDFMNRPREDWGSETQLSSLGESAKKQKRIRREIQQCSDELEDFLAQERSLTAELAAVSRRASEESRRLDSLLMRIQSLCQALLTKEHSVLKGALASPTDSASSTGQTKARHVHLIGLLSKPPGGIQQDPSLPVRLLTLIAERDSLVASHTAAARKREIDGLLGGVQSRRSGKERELERLRSALSEVLADGPVGGGPPARVVLQWPDAEQLACDFLEWLGYRGVRCTGNGADGGVDVESPAVVAQVKMHNRPTGRPEIQRLFGIATVENKVPFFFAMAFSQEAIEWADKAVVRLYKFDRNGTVAAVGSTAALPVQPSSKNKTRRR